MGSISKLGNVDAFDGAFIRFGPGATFLFSFIRRGCFIPEDRVRIAWAPTSGVWVPDPQ
jgi:hypothetical protein